MPPAGPGPSSMAAAATVEAAPTLGARGARKRARAEPGNAAGTGQREREGSAAAQERTAEECATSSAAERTAGTAAEAPSPHKRLKENSLDISLTVQWYSSTGKSKVNHLVLKPLESVDKLSGISQNLVSRAFPVDQRPDYIMSNEFYKFTPNQEFLMMPSDIARTEFRLVATYDGWDYVVLQRDQGAHRDQERNMLVTVIEFESTALQIGQYGVRVSLISYPIVSVKKTFLASIQRELETNPNFKGL